MATSSVGHQRDAGDHPGLIKELAELGRRRKILTEGVQGHLDEPAHDSGRSRKLFDQPRLQVFRYQWRISRETSRYENVDDHVSAALPPLGLTGCS